MLLCVHSCRAKCGGAAAHLTGGTSHLNRVLVDLQVRKQLLEQYLFYSTLLQQAQKRRTASAPRQTHITTFALGELTAPTALLHSPRIVIQQFKTRIVE